MEHYSSYSRLRSDGQSAGICAAMLVEYDYNTANVDVAALQASIKKNGVKIHINEVL